MNRFICQWMMVLWWTLSALVLQAHAQQASTMATWMAPRGDGKLRASINLGNPILASRDASQPMPQGLSVDLAQELAHELNLELELVVVDSAAQAVQAVKEERADIGFFAIDPKRAQGIAFTQPYVLIEGSYLVREDASFNGNQDVDRPGVRIAVGKGSAYDLFLSRELKHAQLVRVNTSPAVVNFFLHEGLDVAAGVKQQLESDMKRTPGLRLLPSHFMVIEQAMGLPQSRNPLAHQYLSEFVQRMKQEGKIAKSLERHRIEGASIAP